MRLKMIKIGKVCMKIAGRDAGKIGVIVDIIDDKYVLIDGQTRRRKCNINHLEFTAKEVEISKDCPTSEVIKALADLDIKCEEKKVREISQPKERPKKQKANKKNKSAEKKPKKEATKKAASSNSAKAKQKAE
jgi:large subunit ribosomal protein L14e